ncbi:MAG: dihydroorotate dehydrogenase [Rhodobacteraceae bacterium]|nr:dihydroorotate dehydrogenase [Paracoccaceae bacterium]
MDKKTQHNDGFDLDDLFAQARAQDAMPSADFMQQVLDDALAAQPGPVVVGPVVVARGRRGGRLRQFLNAVGGWPAMAGLATAGVAGLWIGVNPPDTLATTAETFLGAETDLYLVDLMPGYDFTLAEG